MPLINGIYYLCKKHLADTRRRIDAACEHNQDKSVEWWEAYWEKEVPRQCKLQLEHCHEAE